MDTGVPEPALDGSADDVAAEMPTLSRSSREFADMDGHAKCRELKQILKSELCEAFHDLEIDTDMTKLRDGSAAACQGCIMLLDAVSTYCDGHLLEKRIENINLWYYSTNPYCKIEITLHYLPDKAFYMMSSLYQEKDVESDSKAVMGEATSPLLEVQLELFLLRGMLSLSSHSVVYL
jgi:hypothetical protein